MQSIRNAANAASQAISGGGSGQSGQEPVSGQTGRGTASEPYDAGNTMGNPRLAGLPGDDARPEFSSGRDKDQRGDREDGAFGGSTEGSDNPYQSSTARPLDRESAPMPGTSTMGPGYTSSTSGQLGSGNQATMGSGYTSSTGDRPSGMGSSSIPGISDDFMNVPGGKVEVIDEGPAASGIEGRFGPTHGVDIEGHQFPQGEGRGVSGTGSGGDSYNTTGSSTTAVNTGGSSGVTGYDNTSRDMGDQDNMSSDRGMTGSDMSRGSAGRDDSRGSGGIAGSRNIPGDISGGSGATSTRPSGQEDTMSGPTGGMQQGANVQGDRPRPEHNTDKTGVTDMHSDDPKFSDVRQTEAGGSSVDSRGQSKGPTGGFGTAEPSVSADPGSGQQATPKHQGADRPTEEPTGEQADAVKREKETTEQQQAGDDLGSGGQDQKQPKKDPNDHSGEPLGTVDHSGRSDDKKAAGQEGGGPHGEDKENKGTGEQYVKSSGMAADGGDFDATKPGAGREAERLLEEKGIHHEPGSGGKPAVDPDAPADQSSKGGLTSKLKEKLHMG